MEKEFLLQATVYLGAAILVVPIAKRLGISSVLGYLFAGILIGPFVLGFIGSEGEDILHFAEFGVVMMLFLIGLELEPSRLWNLKKSIFGTGLLQFVSTMVVVAIIAFFIGLKWQASITLGMAMVMSSTAIVLQTFKEKNQLDTDAGQKSFSILIFQDIAVIPILAALPLIAYGQFGDLPGNEDSLITTMPGWLQAVSIIAFVAAVFFIGKYLFPLILKLVARIELRELFTASALLIVVGIAYLTSLVNLSPALGTFLAGVILANSSFRHELVSDLEPFKGLLLGLFFMAVGASISFNLISHNTILILGITLGIITIKAIILYLIGRSLKMSHGQNLVLAFSMSQVGEFAFIILSFAGQLAILNQNETAIMMAIVGLSMATTPLLILINERIILPRLDKKDLDHTPADAIEEKNKVIIAGFSDFGSTLGRFLRANDVEATILDNDPDRVDLLRKMGFKVFFGDATRHDLLKSAGAADADIFISAINSHETNLLIVKMIHKHFPKLNMMIRVRNRPDAYELMNLGVNQVYRENLDTSVRMGIEILKKLGFRAYAVHRAGEKFKEHDEAALHNLYMYTHNREMYIRASKEHMRIQEEILNDDRLRKPNLDDHAWDSDELKKADEE